MSKGLKIVLVILGVTLVLMFMIGGKLITGYNQVITLEENVKGKWAQVENQLKRRYDLIPNLIETVKGYAKHEKEIFENIAQARTQYFQAKDVKNRVESANRLEGALSRLLLLQERYPDLKANQSFLRLQDSLEGTENRIGLSIGNRSFEEIANLMRPRLGGKAGMLAEVGESDCWSADCGSGLC